MIFNLTSIIYADFGTWGDSSLIHSCKNSRGGVVLVESDEECNEDEAEVTWLKDVNAGVGLIASRDNNGVLISADSSGWFSAHETWSYSAADTPSFTVIVSGDKTEKYSPGMRVRLEQTTTKYFIITKIDYSNPNTTITLYGGTDYVLADESITNVYFSTHKAPQGFPLNPAKWTVEVTNSSDIYVTPPTSGSWYNLGSVSIDVPIGAWKVSTNYTISVLMSSGANYANGTLSTQNNAESDSEMTTSLLGNGPIDMRTTVYREKTLILSNKTTYYLLARGVGAQLQSIRILGNDGKTVIRAVSSYL